MNNLKYSCVGSKFALNFSYIGTNYYGVQRQASREVVNTTDFYDNSIQMALDIGLSNLNPVPINTLSSGLSSRTDKDVHALDNYLFTTLVHPRFPEEDYSPDQITDQVNHFLKEQKHSIIVKKSISLPRYYRVYRNTEYREYAYRFMLTDQSLMKRLPPFVVNRLSLIRRQHKYGDIDLQKLQEALSLFVGQHNFRSFEAPSVTETKRGWWSMRDPVKDLSLFQVKPLSPEKIFQELYAEGHELSEESKEILQENRLHEITVRSLSFLYRQVRMMIGISFMVSRNEIPMQRIKFMLDFPHRWHWSYKYFTAHAAGLFLSKVKLKGFE